MHCLSIHWCLSRKNNVFQRDVFLWVFFWEGKRCRSAVIKVSLADTWWTMQGKEFDASEDSRWRTAQRMHLFILILQGDLLWDVFFGNCCSWASRGTSFDCAREHPEVCQIPHKLRGAIGNGLRQGVEMIGLLAAETVSRDSWPFPRPEVWDEFQDKFNIPLVVEPGSLAVFFSSLVFSEKRPRRIWKRPQVFWTSNALRFYGSTEGNGALVNICRQWGDSPSSKIPHPLTFDFPCSQLSISLVGDGTWPFEEVWPATTGCRGPIRFWFRSGRGSQGDLGGVSNRCFLMKMVLDYGSFFQK